MNSSEIEVSSVDAGRGTGWVIEGFAFFQKDWLSWVGLTVLLIVLSMVSSAIPGVNILMPIITPIIIAGLMLGCHEQDQGGEISIATIFAGFSNNAGQLALVGVFYFLANLAIIIVMIILMIIVLGGFDGLSQLSVEDPDLIIRNIFKILLVVLIALTMSLPVVMAMWFAPALIVFHEVTAVQAISLSVKGCLINVLPFLIYGIVIMVLMILATIPFMLGWFVLLPIMISSVYASYKDIYLQKPAISESTSAIAP